MSELTVPSRQYMVKWSSSAPNGLHIIFFFINNEVWENNNARMILLS